MWLILSLVLAQNRDLLYYWFSESNRAVPENMHDHTRMLSLHNVDTTAIESFIKDSLSDDISSKIFDTGYMQGSNIISVCTKEDLSKIRL